MSSTPWSSSRIVPGNRNFRTDGAIHRAPARRAAAAEPHRASRVAVVSAALVLLALVVAGSVALGALIEASVRLFAPS
jgi:hypothetical protein